ncbi:MAG: universal stress protein [Bacteroidota bacterium]
MSQTTVNDFSRRYSTYPMTIKILGMGDTKTRALKDNLDAALSLYPVKGRVVEVSEVNRIALSGVTETPALLFDNHIISEGRVPTVEELSALLRNRFLYKSKLYRLRRILVPVDFSEASETAICFGWELAKHFEASLDVIHAVEGVFDGGIPSPSGILDNYVRTTSAELQSFVQAAFKKHFPEDAPVNAVAAGPGEQDARSSMFKVRMKIEYGFPEVVLEEASQRYDLLVMGTTGKSAIATQLIGSVSVEISQKAHCPVLLVPPGFIYTGFDNILYASNFESNDAEKVKQVVAFSKKFDAQIHFVHVGKVNEPGEKLQRALFEVNYKYSNPNKPFIFQKMVGEDVPEKLHEYAFYHKTNLFVFVTPRRGFWNNLLHRSQTRNMLLHTHSPVLVVHQFNDLDNN